LQQGGVIERLQQRDDILTRKECNRGLGQCLGLGDLGVAAPRIDVINGTDKIPQTSEPNQDTGSIGPPDSKP